MQLAREHLSQHLLPERERSKSETGDDTGGVSPMEDHRRKRSGRTKKRSSQGGEKNDSSVWVSEFGEKMLLFHPAFNVDYREMSEEKVSETDGDGSDLSEDSFKIEERKHKGKKSPGASKRSDTRKRRESKCQPEEDEEESVGERLEAQRREEVESRKAKAKKKSDEEKRRQKEYQNSAKEELKSELMKPSSDTTFLDRTECQSEVDSLKAQMREEVEQLQPEFHLELEAERRKAMEVQEESEQLWSLYREEIRRSVKLDYEERLEKLREELRTEQNNFRQKFKNEVSAQRKNLLSAAQEEKERMRASHAQHLEKLRSEFEKQKQQIQQMQETSESQRRVEQLEQRAKERKNMEDGAPQTPDKLDQTAKASDQLRRERDELRRERDELRRESEELRRELRKAAAEGEKAREVLQKTRQEWDKAKTDEALLKKERDKAVQVCATAVEERARMKKKYKAMEKKTHSGKMPKELLLLQSGYKCGQKKDTEIQE
ncbi:trichohyalin-like [Takifugu rubripes]|uniref:trichohyalin-like n=1 Tax=Takifugu rubripes TaxID=31033 RepID=UPI001145AD1D|nr:trichohyalin-like [Takifugu rubripes]